MRRCRVANVSLRQRLLTVVGAATLLVGAASATATTVPRLVGRYSTTLTITKLSHVVNVTVGQTGLRSWTFRPRCPKGGCTTILQRPSIATGSTAIYVYALEPVSAREYRGSSKPILTPCYPANGTPINGGFTTTQTIDLHITKVAHGRVVAYHGTQTSINIATATGRTHGCAPRGEQDATFKTT